MTNQVALAKEIATKAHEGQFRWDGKTPYIAHPAAIAKAVRETLDRDWGKNLGIHCLGTLDEDRFIRDGYEEMTVYAEAASWLHDVVEDTPLTIADLRARGISEEILTAVDLLTKREDQSYLDYLLRLKNDDGVALLVKIEDIKNNMSDLDRKKKKSMYEKYQLALFILGG